MNALLSELGKSLATRWLSYLMPTGLLFLGAAGTGLVLGHARWYDLPAVADRLDAWASGPDERALGAGLAVAAGIVLLATAVGLLVRALGTVVDRIWLGTWPRGARRLATGLTERRRARWAAADQRVREAWRQHAARRALTGASDPDDRTPALRIAERDRVCLVPPGHPTWIGDRVAATDQRILATYGLDLAAAWPRLWLVCPEETRAELRTARRGYDAATQLVAWSPLYLALAVWWWPALLIAATTLVVGVRRGRAAMDTFCWLAESVVDLHGRDLATALGLSCSGPLYPETGRRVTARLRKDR
ncbi:hypothetical protein RM844_25770 [Streptomyces sp. DSM 44915]|uniref:Vegetative cell wall protein gp1 n=1 Tax=Streptomyces chisholmiae TaxID=3075540 RepID=A0ABU2JXH1_9ACTN|nr:hypothetical protein [Streptomyces sp. DSM 44915]MDT0269697.1 hypothetical protein [Streptomyces sp. DSM 44915]